METKNSILFFGRTILFIVLAILCPIVAGFCARVGYEIGDDLIIVMLIWWFFTAAVTGGGTTFFLVKLGDKWHLSDKALLYTRIITVIIGFTTGVALCIKLPDYILNLMQL